MKFNTLLENITLWSMIGLFILYNINIANRDLFRKH